VAIPAISVAPVPDAGTDNTEFAGRHRRSDEIHRSAQAGAAYRSWMEPVRFDHYLAGVVGLGLLRHWYADGETNAVRMAELADILAKADESTHSLEVTPVERSVGDGYAEWAATYDGQNPMIELEESVVVPLLERLAGPGRRALDAACGTGRHARLLDACGCATTGIDQSPEMLDVARRKVPNAVFQVGDVEHLPFDDGAFDLAVVSLALCHLPDPTVAVAELARVLAVGGTLVVSDPHPMGGVLGGQAFYGGVGRGRTLSFVRNHRHSASIWLRAFAGAGLQVVDCAEATFTDEQIAGDPSSAFHPEAARAAATGLPSVWIWELRRTSERNESRNAGRIPL
jgi:SAM-dependent methyltransferase